MIDYRFWQVSPAEPQIKKSRKAGNRASDLIHGPLNTREGRCKIPDKLHAISQVCSGCLIGTPRLFGGERVAVARIQPNICISLSLDNMLPRSQISAACTDMVT